jgi:hypothetical protein
MKYRTKHQCVEAIRFNPKQLPWPVYIKPWSLNIPLDLNHMGYIETAEGRIPVQTGEWVVIEDDKYYVWSDKNFRLNYVEE